MDVNSTNTGVNGQNKTEKYAEDSNRVGCSSFFVEWGGGGLRVCLFTTTAKILAKFQNDEINPIFESIFRIHFSYSVFTSNHSVKLLDFVFAEGGGGGGGGAGGIFVSSNLFSSASLNPPKTFAIFSSSFSPASLQLSVWIHGIFVVAMLTLACNPPEYSASYASQYGPRLVTHFRKEFQQLSCMFP